MKVDVLLPIPSIKAVFTYKIPPQIDKIYIGQLITVPVKKRILQGIVIGINNENTPVSIKLKNIHSVVSSGSLLLPMHLRFWRWLAEYYMTSLGEVFKASMPTNLFTIYNEISTQENIKHIKIHTSIRSRENLIEIIQNLKNAPKQLQLLKYILYLKTSSPNIDLAKGIPLKELLTDQFEYAVAKRLVQKNILEIFCRKKKFSQLTSNKFLKLNSKEKRIFRQIEDEFLQHQVILYQHIDKEKQVLIHLIKRYINQKKSVLYLHPNIGSLKQSFAKLQPYFKDFIFQYHADSSLKSKAKIWKIIQENKRPALILGVRSLLLLPFRNVAMIIIHNEHNWMHKQLNKQPYFHTRDAAIMYAKYLNSKVLLHEFAPSFESYKNIRTKKYGCLKGEVKKRIPLEIIDTSESKRKKIMISDFSLDAINLCKEVLLNKKNILIFKNRLGFSHYIKCKNCAHIPYCLSCNVSLTYDKENDLLTCNICKQKHKVPLVCPACNKGKFKPQGYGIQRLLIDLKEIFPNIKIAHVNSTLSTKEIKDKLYDLQKNKLQILISSKIEFSQFCFKNIGLVLMLDFDESINYPNFRAEEKCMQQIFQLKSLMYENSILGIQTTQPNHELLKFISEANYESFINAKIAERKFFAYPPFCRIIEIIIQHKNMEKLNNSFDRLIKQLEAIKNIQVTIPKAYIPEKFTNFHFKSIMVKLIHNEDIKGIKKDIYSSINEFKKKNPRLRINCNVDA